MAMTSVPELADDPRIHAIMGAAFGVFGQYGYRKTSMEDIARAAGMSRAALYLHYRNKEDIYRSLVGQFFEGGIKALEVVLIPGLPASEAFPAGLEAMGGGAIEAMIASTHGRELLDAKSDIAGDLGASGEARMIAVWGEWFEAEAKAGRLSLAATDGDGRALARMFMAGWHGVKEQCATVDEYREAMSRMTAIFAASVRV